ncbi:MAG: hypothetical protein QOH76_3807 [Thermoleophilaceae bacterium]|nr:hypothetical protein [Thermoleophilaceae bacterium]
MARGLRWPLALAAAALAAMVLLPGAASAYSTAPGYLASNYATAFPFDDCCARGPLGVAFDASDNLYASNSNGHLYRFQPGGGIAGLATRLTARPIGGSLRGLAFTRRGGLYLARAVPGDVVEIDQATGRPKRTVASGLPCPTGLAADPKSGDLFVSQTCTPAIVRLSGFASGPASRSTYAPATADGIAFAPNGTLYAASADHVLQIDGTGSATPGTMRSVAVVPHSDGVAVGVVPSGAAPFLVVNRNDGKITRLDFAKTPPEQSTIFSGGSRGDFVAVNSRGCLFATQTRSIVRIAPPGKRCDLTPSTPGAGTGKGSRPGITIDTVNPPKRRKCFAVGALVVRVRQHGRIRLRSIRVYVNGRYRKTLRKRQVTAPIVIRHLPRGVITVKLVARTIHGRTFTAKGRYRVCTR